MPPVRINKRSKNKKVDTELPEDMSISTLKKKIRDTERILRRTTEKSSAKGQLSLERQLKALKIIYIEKLTSSRENEIVSKYRMVKHFDRKKVERAIKKTEKLIDTAEDDQEKNELEEKLRELKIDYNYVMKYLSLYPTSDADDQEMISRRNLIRESIKESMKNNDFITDDPNLTMIENDDFFE
nr:12027_t:CDS:2 [Entrophospora candida]CAG8535747.1 5493_t:CDS:2 [Entrophospora candida]